MVYILLKLDFISRRDAQGWSAILSIANQVVGYVSIPDFDQPVES